MPGTRMRATGVALIAALAISAALAGASCGTAPPANTFGLKSATQLAAVEVREYQGQRLDSILDFRENSIHGPQYVDPGAYRLKVDGLVRTPASYTVTQVAEAFPHFAKVVTLDCVEGWSAKVLWEGVMVRDILNASSVQPTATTVIFHARDGYTTSFPLEYFMDNDRIMAFRMNGQPLAPERGYPFMVVAEDKWGYKWVKWIDRIQVSSNSDYRGYWETRGYSNDGSLDKPYLGR